MAPAGGKKSPQGQLGSRLHRNSELLSTIKYGNGGGPGEMGSGWDQGPNQDQGGNISGLSTGRDPIRRYLASRVGSGQEAVKAHRSGRVGSGRVGSGRVGSGRVTWPDPTSDK